MWAANSPPSPMKLIVSVLPAITLSTTVNSVVRRSSPTRVATAWGARAGAGMAAGAELVDGITPPRGRVFSGSRSMRFSGDEAGTFRLHAEARQQCDDDCSAKRDARERDAVLISIVRRDGGLDRRVCRRE